MTSTLALAAIGAWSYAGFLAGPAELPAVPSTPAPAPSAPGAPIAYRPVDARGLAWEHADPAYLRSFVEARNRSIAVPYSSPTPETRLAPACAGGRCR